MPALAGDAYRSDGLRAPPPSGRSAYLDGPATGRLRQRSNVLRLPPPFRGHVERFQALPRGLSGVPLAYIPLADLVALQTDSPKIEIAESLGTLRRPTPAPGDSSGAER